MIDPKDYIFDEEFIVFNDKITDSDFTLKYLHETNKILLPTHEEYKLVEISTRFSKLKSYHKYEIDEIGTWTNCLTCYLDIITGPITSSKDGSKSIPILRIVGPQYEGVFYNILRLDLFCFKGYADLRDNNIIKIIT